MARFPLRFAVSFVAPVLVLSAAIVAWSLATGSSQAQQGAMHNCPLAGKWAISVWEGPDATPPDDALALCGPDAVDAAYSLDAQTGSWWRWFAGKPDVSNLPPFDDMQGILALGSATAAATTDQPPTAAQASNELQHCPPPGKWSIAVWDGQSGTAPIDALAACGSGAITAVYSLDAQTGAWSRWFADKPDLSNLPPLDNMQGIIALRSMRSDADIIATSILSRQSREPMFDPEEFADLRDELDNVLRLIRDAYPAMASIHARDHYIVGQIGLGLESPLKAAVESFVASQPDGAGLVTGQKAFDSLNAELGGVRAVWTSLLGITGSVVLFLDPLVNVRAASLAYWELDGIRYAEANGAGGGAGGPGPDIDALRDGDTWYVAFLHAWWDCLECTDEELDFFTVEGGTVISVEPDVAEVDPRFAKLKRWVHGQETWGIGVYWEQNPVNGEFVITSPFVDSPAQQAGIQPGDVILAFDGKSTTGWTEDDFWARNGGFEGWAVTLTVRHTDGNVEDISFVRAAIYPPMATEVVRIGVYLESATPAGVLLVSASPNFVGDPAVVRPGDRLLAVNGESTATWTVAETVDYIDSFLGEQMTLTLRHIDGMVEDVTVSTRYEICPDREVATYAGVVYLDGVVAPSRSLVTAVQGGRELSTGITWEGGRYELSLVRGIPPCVSDAPVFFRWEGHTAVSWDDLMALESADASPGRHELDLTFTSPTATPGQ